MGEGQRRREFGIYSKGEGRVWWCEIKGLYDTPSCPKYRTYMTFLKYPKKSKK